ncbi:MAG: hypothetical protein DME26_05845 [Verrucomicrobia bacterium]|nr:MAG: hypothetical protein DME26_05845 [Verrucomicrobiota bacterium]
MKNPDPFSFFYPWKSNFFLHPLQTNVNGFVRTTTLFDDQPALFDISANRWDERTALAVPEKLMPCIGL